MGKTSHHIPIDDIDWTSLNLYCDFKGTNPTTVIGTLIYNFLRDKKDELNRLIEEQKKIVDSRNGG